MAHKVNVGGTAYEIGGGKTLIGGTAYSIDKGKTLVGGTAYEVGFVVQMATLTIIGRGDSAYCGIVIDGTICTSAAEVEVPVGTVIRCFVYGFEDECEEDGGYVVYVNGERMTLSGGTDGTVPYYDYIVTTDAIIELYVDEDTCGYCNSEYVSSRIKINKIPAGCFKFMFGGIFYIAEEGMTWAEWSNSEYPSISYYTKFVVEGDYVKQSAGSSYAIVLNDIYVKPTDVIVSDAIYTTKLTPPVPVEIKLQVDNDTYCIVEIDGQSYLGSHVLTLYTRTKITCKVMEWGGKAIITRNGTTVASTSSHTGIYRSYSYTVSGPATIHGYYDYNNVGGRIDITET